MYHAHAARNQHARKGLRLRDAAKIPSEEGKTQEAKKEKDKKGN